MKNNPVRHAAFLLKRVVTHKNILADKALAPFGVSMASWAVLITIAKNPGLSTHALALNCFVTDQSCGQIIAKLAAQSLIERKPGPGKAILHELTPRGKELLENSDPALDKAMEDIFLPLKPEETALLVTFLERLLNDQNI